MHYLILNNDGKSFCNLIFLLSISSLAYGGEDVSFSHALKKDGAVLPFFLAQEASHKGKYVEYKAMDDIQIPPLESQEKCTGQDDTATKPTKKRNPIPQKISPHHYLCPYEICKKALTRRAYLRDHLKNHVIREGNDNLIPYRCTECGYANLRKALLKAHIGKEHKLKGSKLRATLRFDADKHTELTRQANKLMPPLYQKHNKKHVLSDR